MTRIEELEREIELTKELIELKKQLLQPIVVQPIYVQPFLQPVVEPQPYVSPYQPATAPYITWGSGTVTDKGNVPYTLTSTYGQAVGGRLNG